MRLCEKTNFIFSAQNVRKLYHEKKYAFLQNKNLKPIVNYAGRHTTWRCMSFSETCEMAIGEGNMNAKKYVDTL